MRIRTTTAVFLFCLASVFTARAGYWGGSSDSSSTSVIYKTVNTTNAFFPGQLSGWGLWLTSSPPAAIHLVDPAFASGVLGTDPGGNVVPFAPGNNILFTGGYISLAPSPTFTNIVTLTGSSGGLITFQDGAGNTTTTIGMNVISTGAGSFSSYTNLPLRTIAAAGYSGTPVSGVVGAAVVVEGTGQIVGWDITAQGSSPTNSWDVWKIAAGTAVPTAANCIATNLALTTGNVLRSTSLANWSSGTNVTKGDIFLFNLNGFSTGSSNIQIQVIGKLFL